MAINWGNNTPICEDWDINNKYNFLEFTKDWDRNNKYNFLEFTKDWDKTRETNLFQFAKIGIKYFPISSIILPLLFATNCSPKAPPLNIFL